MEYIYAAMLLHKAGKDVTEDTVKAVLTAAGVQVDEARIKALVAALQGVNIEEAIAKAAVAAPVAAAALKNLRLEGDLVAFNDFFSLIIIPPLFVN